MKWARTAPEAFGVTTAEALKSVNVLGSLLTSQGMARDSALSMSQEYVRVGTALDSAFSKERGYSADAITSALQGNYRMLREVGIVTDATAVATRAMTDTGKTSAAQLTQQEKAAALYAIVMEESQAAQKQFGDGSQSLGQQMATADAKLREAQTTMGEALLPVLLQLFKAIQPLLDLVMNAAKKFTEWRGVTVPLTLAITAIGAALWIANGAVAAYNVVQGIAAGITAARTGAEVTGTAALVAKTIATGAMAAATGVASAASAVWTGVQWLLNAALLANPIGIVVIAIAALVGAIILAYRNSETFRNIVQAAFNAVSAAVQFAWSWIQNIAGAISGLISWAARVTPIGAIFQTVGSIISGAFSAAVGAIQTVINAIQRVIDLAGKVKDAIGGALGGLGGILGLSAPVGYAYAAAAQAGGGISRLALGDMPATRTPGVFSQAESFFARAESILGQRRGPALVIQNATIREPVDVTVLLRKTEFLVQAGRL
jgi:phage-related protein